MKRLNCLLICIALLLSLAACVGAPGETYPSIAPNEISEHAPNESTAPGATEPEAQPLFTRENFPRLNGSTSTVPLGQAIASVLLGESRAEVADLIRFSKTTQSYRALMYRESDLLIAAEPAESIWQEKEVRGFEWEMEPFAIDGLVFLVNADNPVDSLTVEQIQKIYTGEITNWSQVGGDDLDIIPFQRNAEAGSQTAMLKLVMKDLPMMDAPTDTVIGGMAELIQAVAAYDGTPAAIGYTVYYYANDMKMAEGLKLLAVEGVRPSAKTIRSGAYPLLNNYYVLTAAGLAEDDPARILYNWILSEEGQRLVAHEGYVSVLDVGDTGEWSGLDPYAEKEPLFTYSDHYRGGETLQAADDYGTLLPYVGAALSDVFYDLEPLYGLMTADGRIVTDAIYSYVTYEEGVLVLGRIVSEESTLLTLAARDGSWVQDAGEAHLYPRSGSIPDLIPVENRNGDLVFWNRDGEIVVQFPKESFYKYLGSAPRDNGDLLLIGEYNGLAYMFAVPYWDENGEFHDSVNLYLDISAGTVLDDLPAGYPEVPDDSDEPEVPKLPGYASVHRYTDGATGKDYYIGYWVNSSGEYGYRLLDLDGTVLWEDYSGPYHFVYAGMISAWQDHNVNGAGTFCWYNLETGACVFRYPIADNSD